MIFNDIVESYKELNNTLLVLTDIYDIASSVVCSADNIIQDAITLTYSNRSSNNYTPLADKITKEVNFIKQSMLKVNLLKLGKIIRTIELSNTSEIRKDVTKTLICTIENFADSIYEFNDTSNNNFPNLFIELFYNARLVINEIDIVKSLINEINRFDIMLINNPDNLEKDNIFSIRLYNENLSVQDINVLMKSISSIYERSCTIFNIPIVEYPLQPVKIESGSLLEKVFGHEKILHFMGDLFNRAINFLHRNYTKEGKISTIGTKIDILKEEIELINLCEQYGLDTSIAKEALENNLNIICNDILKVTASSTKISVNGETHDLSKVIEAKMIANIPMSLTATTEDDDINSHTDM